MTSSETSGGFCVSMYSAEALISPVMKTGCALGTTSVSSGRSRKSGTWLVRSSADSTLTSTLKRSSLLTPFSPVVRRSTTTLLRSALSVTPPASLMACRTVIRP